MTRMPKSWVDDPYWNGRSEEAQRVFDFAEKVCEANRRRFASEAKAKREGQFGWDLAGNCAWCGEAGRCQCDHRFDRRGEPER